MLEEENEPVSLETPKEGSEEYVLQYPLTPAQQKISDQCAKLIDTDDILLNCVCGAGKTETGTADKHSCITSLSLLILVHCI